MLIEAFHEIIVRAPQLCLLAALFVWLSVHCSTNSSSLTMANVPWHKDVREFSLALAAAAGGGEYELAAEHVHSCCCLLARPKLFKDSEGRWHTWINYERFHDLVSSFNFNRLNLLKSSVAWNTMFCML